MNKFFKDIIEEEFKSKKQQRFFYAKANDKKLNPKERKKWKTWSKEFSDKTDFENLPGEVDEIVDTNGNISFGKKPANFSAKGVTDNETGDEVVKQSAGSMGTHGVHGTHTTLRYWAEADMSKALGYNDTLGKDADYDSAENHFEDELGLDDDEAKMRLNQMGYDKKLEDDKVRLVENPRKYIEEYIDSILKNKDKTNDLVKKNTEIEENDISPIVMRQIKSLKSTIDNNNISVNDVIKYLKNNE